MEAPSAIFGCAAKHFERDPQNLAGMSLHNSVLKCLSLFTSGAEERPGCVVPRVAVPEHHLGAALRNWAAEGEDSGGSSWRRRGKEQRKDV